MARRIVNRKEKRAEYDAAERRNKDSEEVVDESEEEVEDEEEQEEGDEEEEGAASEEEDAGDEEAGDDDEDRPAPPPKKKKAAKAPAKPKRTRTPKITRKRVVWHVFNNSNQKVAEFEYPKRKDAEDLAAKLTNDKKNTHFVQPVKVDMET